jgi:hypothetical protein
MNSNENELLKWQLDLCESKQAGYHEGRMVDIRKYINAEPINEKGLVLIIKKINEKLR